MIGSLPGILGSAVPHTLLLALWIGLSAVAAAIAITKGYNGLVVLGLSMLGSPFLALPAILLVPRREEPPEVDLAGLPAIATCEHCTGKVIRTASCCLHCGAEMPAVQVVVPFPIAAAR